MSDMPVPEESARKPAQPAGTNVRPGHSSDDHMRVHSFRQWRVPFSPIMNPLPDPEEKENHKDLARRIQM